MIPDWELNPQPSGYRMMLQPTKPRSQGNILILLKKNKKTLFSLEVEFKPKEICTICHVCLYQIAQQKLKFSDTHWLRGGDLKNKTTEPGIQKIDLKIPGKVKTST